MRNRVTAMLLVVGLLFSFTGCSFVNLDVDTQLRAPHAAGEQYAIQTALEQHIYEQNAQTSEETDIQSPVPVYVLKYPRMGDYRSAFVMKDMNGDGVDDALAFYAMQPEGANTHIALLSKRSEGWVCVDDIEGLATEIERINFGDLNGDGVPELFAGFSMFNTRDRRLMLYTWSEDHFVERYSDTYTSMVVGSMVDEGQDDLLLFRLNATEEKTEVRLLTMENDIVIEKGAASLDGHIQQFGRYTFAELEDGTRALYQDCSKASLTTITELIVWDGEQLSTPLYDPAENITTHSARESALPSMDIDEDGEIEWPQCFRMPGDETTEADGVALWLSEWYAWNVEMKAPVKKLTNVVNTTDDYYLRIPDEWVGLITVRYAESQRCLTVMKVTDGVVGDELFRIVAMKEGEDNPFGDEGYLFLDSDQKTRYELCYTKEADFALSMEQLSDLFVMCEFE